MEEEELKRLKDNENGYDKGDVEEEEVEGDIENPIQKEERKECHKKEKYIRSVKRIYYQKNIYMSLFVFTFVLLLLKFLLLLNIALS